jgi:dihydroorotase
MNYFLPKVKIVCPGSTWNGITTNLRFSESILISIGHSVEPSLGDEILEEGLVISPGWIELRAKFYDPGFPEKEDLASGALAASLGGYTHVGVLPHASPCIDNRTGVRYLLEKAKNLPAKILVIGSLSKGMLGTEMAELSDMKGAGCTAFSDGGLPIANTVFLKTSLQYAASTDSVVFIRPDDAFLSQYGDAREGIHSTLAGIQSIPEISEAIGVERIARVIAYTGCRVHLTSISTISGLEILQHLKSSGLPVSADVSISHLLFNDKEILDYDSNFKLSPPLGNEETQHKLREAVLSGLIDTVSADHDPHEVESKQCEFHLAKSGMSSIQGAFSLLMEAMPSLPHTRLVELLSSKPREILRMKSPLFLEGETVDYTLFKPDGNSEFSTSNWASESTNFPKFGSSLKGKVIMTAITTL